MDKPSSVIDINTLDFLRGLAAMYVVINHVRGSFFIGGEKLVSEVGWRGLTVFDYIGLSLLNLTALGEEFVIVFFVISGFAMANSIRSSTSPIGFYKKRIIRLWPTYLMACGLAVGLCALMILTAPASQIAGVCVKSCTALSVAKLVLYVNGHPLAPQFWSLPYEVLFYAVCPLIMQTRQRVALTFIVSCVMAAVGLVLYGICFLPADFVIVNFLLTTMLFFSCGAMLYHFSDKVPRVTLPVFLSIVGSALLAAAVLKFVMGGSNLILSLWMVVLTCFVIVNLPLYKLSLRRANVGAWSYSIYVFHYQFIVLFAFILLEVFGVTASQIRGYGWWILPILPVLLCCRGLYFISERPCNTILERMRSNERSKRNWLQTTKAPPAVACSRQPRGRLEAIGIPVPK